MFDSMDERTFFEFFDLFICSSRKKEARPIAWEVLVSNALPIVLFQMVLIRRLQTSRVAGSLARARLCLIAQSRPFTSRSDLIRREIFFVHVVIVSAFLCGPNIHLLSYPWDKKDDAVSFLSRIDP